MKEINLKWDNHIDFLVEIESEMMNCFLGKQINYPIDLNDVLKSKIEEKFSF